MHLNKRDKAILNYIRRQDFCFYKDIVKFFPSYSTASRRLNELSKNGYVIIEDIKFNRFENILDEKSLNLIGYNKKIVYLRKSHLSKFEYLKLSRYKINHQVLLSQVKQRLEKLLCLPAFFEYDIRERRRTLESGGHEPYPDFYFNGKGFKLAIELELNIKSQNRYDLKVIDYSLSSFSHVLYIVGFLKKKDKLLDYFAFKDGIGIAHYAEPEIVFSYSQGKTPLLEWLEKEQEINKDESNE